MRLWSNRYAPVLTSALLAGCAHVVTEPDGTRHITGFVVLTVPPVTQEVGADAIRLRSLGLTVVQRRPEGTQFTLGYADTTVVAMRNDSAISRRVLRLAVQGGFHTEE